MFTARASERARGICRAENFFTTSIYSKLEPKLAVYWEVLRGQGQVAVPVRTTRSGGEAEVRCALLSCIQPDTSGSFAGVIRHRFSRTPRRVTLAVAGW